MDPEEKSEIVFVHVDLYWRAGSLCETLTLAIMV